MISTLIGGVANRALTFTMGDFVAPTIEWSPSDQVVKWGRNAAFVLIVIWIFYYIKKVALPGNSRLGGRGEGGKLVGLAAVVLILMNLNGVPDVVNLILKIIWFVGDMVNFPGMDAK